MSMIRDTKPAKAAAENARPENSPLSQPTRPFTVQENSSHAQEAEVLTGNMHRHDQFSEPSPGGIEVVQMNHKKKKRSTGGQSNLERHQEGKRQGAQHKKDTFFQNLKRRYPNVTMDISEKIRKGKLPMSVLK